MWLKWPSQDKLGIKCPPTSFCQLLQSTYLTRQAMVYFIFFLLRNISRITLSPGQGRLKGQWVSDVHPLPILRSLKEPAMRSPEDDRDDFLHLMTKAWAGGEGGGVKRKKRNHIPSPSWRQASHCSSLKWRQSWKQNGTEMTEVWSFPPSLHALRQKVIHFT